MKCFITSCTRKASNVAFQTLQSEKVREKSTGKWNVLKRHELEKQLTDNLSVAFQKVREKSTGKWNVL